MNQQEVMNVINTLEKILIRGAAANDVYIKVAKGSEVTKPDTEVLAQYYFDSTIALRSIIQMLKLVKFCSICGASLKGNASFKRSSDSKEICMDCFNEEHYKGESKL